MAEQFSLTNKQTKNAADEGGDSGQVEGAADSEEEEEEENDLEIVGWRDEL